jgi:hypothetical protein
MIGVLGLGLGCWATGASAQSVDLSRSDIVKSMQIAKAYASPATAGQLVQNRASSRDLTRRTVVGEDVLAGITVSADGNAKLKR